MHIKKFLFSSNYFCLIQQPLQNWLADLELVPGLSWNLTFHSKRFLRDFQNFQQQNTAYVLMWKCVEMVYMLYETLNQSRTVNGSLQNEC